VADPRGGGDHPLETVWGGILSMPPSHLMAYKNRKIGILEVKK